MGYAEIHIAEELLRDLLTQDRDVTHVSLRCVEGLPEDARLRSADVWRNGDVATLILSYESTEWIGDMGVLNVQFSESFRNDS